MRPPPSVRSTRRLGSSDVDGSSAIVVRGLVLLALAALPSCEPPEAAAVSAEGVADEGADESADEVPAELVAAPGTVVGYVSSTIAISSANEASVGGWACRVGQETPLTVTVGSGDSATAVGRLAANLPASSGPDADGIRRHCQTRSSSFRFRFPLSRELRLARAGEVLTFKAEGQLLRQPQHRVPHVNPLVTTTRGQTWFAPLVPSAQNCNHEAVARETYMSLFPAAGAASQWPTAARGVSVFKFFGSWMEDKSPPAVPGGPYGPSSNPYAATDAELTRALDFLRRSNVATALEVPALLDPQRPVPSWCVSSGMSSARWIYRVQRMKPALDAVNAAASTGPRASLDYLSLDEPFSHASLVSNPKNVDPATGVARPCLSASETALHVAYTVRQARGVFPGLRVGLVEFLWRSDVGASRYKAILEAYRAAVGEYPAFFHLDASYASAQNATLMAIARELQAYATARGIKFGMIHVCGKRPVPDASCSPPAPENTATSDLQCAEQMLWRANKYQTTPTGAPHHALYQSWFTHPRVYTPDSTRGTFTHTLTQAPRFDTLR